MCMCVFLVEAAIAGVAFPGTSRLPSPCHLRHVNMHLLNIVEASFFLLAVDMRFEGSQEYVLVGRRGGLAGGGGMREERV